MACGWKLAAAAVVLCVLPAASGWLLEGLVGSWVMPDVQAGQRKRVEPERTEPLQLPAEDHEQEPEGFAPLRPHPSTPPPEQRAQRTSPEEKATATVRDIETTPVVQLYRQLFKDRRQAKRNPNPSNWKGSKPTCIQRFICEVHMQEDHELAKAGDVEKNIANMLKRFNVESPDSRAYQYTYAAHMGRLMRDSPLSGCHEMFSACPFSKDDMVLLLQTLSSAKATLS